MSPFTRLLSERWWCFISSRCAMFVLSLYHVCVFVCMYARVFVHLCLCARVCSCRWFSQSWMILSYQTDVLNSKIFLPCYELPVLKSQFTGLGFIWLHLFIFFILPFCFSKINGLLTSSGTSILPSSNVGFLYWKTVLLS